MAVIIPIVIKSDIPAIDHATADAQHLPSFAAMPAFESLGTSENAWHTKICVKISTTFFFMFF